jgi:hypothetical protein
LLILLGIADTLFNHDNFDLDQIPEQLLNSGFYLKRVVLGTVAGAFFAFDEFLLQFADLGEDVFLFAVFYC